MNGALYISFFQGQLESALEQVVQLAVQEITKTVGASLNLMLLETATKEQENKRLRSTLQQECTAQDKAEARAETSTSGQTTKPERSDCRGLEQKRRAVGQLKVVMEQVLEFAVCELSKIVEDSFDDLLLELTKAEQENQELKEKLHDSAEDNGGLTTETQAQENQSNSPSSSEGARQESNRQQSHTGAKEHGKEQPENTDDSSQSDKQTVITVTQDWVPILDKVFGQKWCSDIWQIKELNSSKEDHPGLGSGTMPNMDSLIRESLNPASQKNLEGKVDQLEWLHDSDILSPSSDPQCTSVTSSVGDESQLRSPSMLHRLLTLPTQLLEGDEDSLDAIPSLADPEEPRITLPTPGQSTQTVKLVNNEEEEEEEEEESREEEHEPKSLATQAQESSRSKDGKKVHTCKECGRKFSRAHLLKAHRQTHRDTGAPCPQCGKTFLQLAKLQAHMRTHSGKTT